MNSEEIIMTVFLVLMIGAVPVIYLVSRHEEEDDYLGTKKRSR